MEIYVHTKFRWEISIHGWDKTFGFGHIGILFPVLILTQFSSSVCDCASTDKVLSQLNNSQRSYDVISNFSRWRPAAILDLIWIILDHPQSAVVGLNLTFQFGLDRIYSFGDIEILPRCMHCMRRGLATRRVSLRPSIKRVDCDKMEERSVQILYYTKDRLS